MIEDINPFIHPIVSHSWSGSQRQQGEQSSPVISFPATGSSLGTLSAPMTDDICNPSDMLWVCPAFPPSLSWPEHFQREAPRHLNWLLSEELVAWYHGPPNSLSSSLWNVKWGQPSCREISSHVLVSTLCTPRAQTNCNSRIPLRLVWKWGENFRRIQTQHRPQESGWMTPVSTAKISDAGSLSCGWRVEAGWKACWPGGGVGKHEALWTCSIKKCYWRMFLIILSCIRFELKSLTFNNYTIVVYIYCSVTKISFHIHYENRTWQRLGLDCSGHLVYPQKVCYGLFIGSVAPLWPDYWF